MFRWRGRRRRITVRNLFYDNPCPCDHIGTQAAKRGVRNNWVSKEIGLFYSNRFEMEAFEICFVFLHMKPANETQHIMKASMPNQMFQPLNCTTFFFYYVTVHYFAKAFRFFKPFIHINMQLNGEQFFLRSEKRNWNLSLNCL